MKLIHGLLLIILLFGCAAHVVHYDFGPPVASPGPAQPIRVALAPIPTRLYVSQIFFNHKALTDLLAQQLTYGHVFESVETVKYDVSKNNPDELQRLKQRGFQAVLAARVVQVEGGRSYGTMQAVGQILASPALMIAGSLENTFYAATSTVEFKLISTANGRTLWYGTSIGTANGREGMKQTLDTSLGAAFRNLIKDLSEAQIEKAG